MKPEVATGRVLIVGATGTIARAIAARFVKAGYKLIVAGRDPAELEYCAADLRIRYQAHVDTTAYDALAFESHQSFFDRCVKLGGAEGLAGVILCHGVLPGQPTAQTDWKLARDSIDANFTSAALLLNEAAEYFSSRKAGFIAALCSVAGDRGRQSNYIYGAAKGGLAIFLQGLRQRMAKSGVTVLTAKPGFVDTAMTWGLPGLFLVATPGKVADDIYRAIDRGSAVLYTPWFWACIMAMIQSIPERIFNRLKL